MSKEVLVHGGAYPVQAPVQSYSFSEIQRMATSIAKSGFFGVKDVDQAMTLMLMAQGLNKHPALIMRDYHIINNRLSKSAEAMLRDFQASGGRVIWHKYADDGCSGEFSHPLSPKPIIVDWDMERAKKAGLAKDGGMYSKFARAMFRSRVISEGVRTCAPGATEGFYTPEEIRTMTEEELPAPVSMEAAVAQAAEEVTKELPEDEMDSLIESLDVTTKIALISAYNSGLRIIKDRGNQAQFLKFKSWKDQMLSVIEGSPPQPGDAR